MTRTLSALLVALTLAVTPLASANHNLPSSTIVSQGLDVVMTTSAQNGPSAVGCSHSTGTFYCTLWQAIDGTPGVPTTTPPPVQCTSNLPSGTSNVYVCQEQRPAPGGYNYAGAYKGDGTDPFWEPNKLHAHIPIDTVDPDGDGKSTNQEISCGTNPVDPLTYCGNDADVDGIDDEDEYPSSQAPIVGYYLCGANAALQVIPGCRDNREHIGNGCPVVGYASPVAVCGEQVWIWNPSTSAWMGPFGVPALFPRTVPVDLIACGWNQAPPLGEDMDGDGIPNVALCDGDLTIRPNGSLRWDNQQPTGQSVGDPDDGDPDVPVDFAQLNGYVQFITNNVNGAVTFIEDTAQEVVANATHLANSIAAQVMDLVEGGPEAVQENATRLTGIVEATRDNAIAFATALSEDAGTAVACIDAEAAAYLQAADQAAQDYQTDASQDNFDALVGTLGTGSQVFAVNAGSCFAPLVGLGPAQTFLAALFNTTAQQLDFLGDQAQELGQDAGAFLLGVVGNTTQVAPVLVGAALDAATLTLNLVVQTAQHGANATQDAAESALLILQALGEGDLGNEPREVDGPLRNDTVEPSGPVTVAGFTIPWAAIVAAVAVVALVLTWRRRK